MIISQAIIKLEQVIETDRELEKTVGLLERNLVKQGKKTYLICIV